MVAKGGIQVVVSWSGFLSPASRTEYGFLHPTGKQINIRFKTNPVLIGSFFPSENILPDACDN